MMTLEDTIELMLSEDYRDRFAAEYAQLSMRHERLRAMLTKWDAGCLEFTPTCPRAVLQEQAEAMLAYMAALEKRADLEGIDLGV